MLNTNCAQCGVVNYSGDEICISCGANLIPRSFSPIRDKFREWQPLIDPDRTFPGLRPFTFSAALTQTFSLFLANLWPITKIVFVVVTPFEIFKILSLSDVKNDFQFVGWTFLLGLVSKLLAAPALIYALMKVLQTGVAPGVQESYRWGLTKLPKLAICALISGVLQALGYMLLIIPGIIVYVTLVLVYPVAVLEKRSVTKTLGRSAQLTRGHRLEIFVTELALALLLIVMNIPAAVVGAAGMFFWPLAVVAALVGDVLEQMVTVLSLVMYLTLPRFSDRGHFALPANK